MSGDSGEIREVIAGYKPEWDRRLCAMHNRRVTHLISLPQLCFWDNKNSSGEAKNFAPLSGNIIVVMVFPEKCSSFKRKSR